jgi:hypothetical protein
MNQEVRHSTSQQLAHNRGHLHEIWPSFHHIADEHGHLALSHKLPAKVITDGTPARILMRVWGWTFVSSGIELERPAPVPTSGPL